MPAAQQRPAWRTRTARPVKVRPALSSSSSNRSGPARRRPPAGRSCCAETTRRPGACRPAATIACPSIWLPSTTGRRPSLRATPTKRQVAVGADVQQVDQVRGVTPGGEPLDGDVACRRPAGARRRPRPGPGPGRRCRVRAARRAARRRRWPARRGRRRPRSVSIRRGPTSSVVEACEVDVGVREVEDGRLAVAPPRRGTHRTRRPGPRPTRRSPGTGSAQTFTVRRMRAEVRALGVDGRRRRRRARRHRHRGHAEAAAVAEERVDDGDELLDLDRLSLRYLRSAHWRAELDRPAPGPSRWRTRSWSRPRRRRSHRRRAG